MGIKKIALVIPALPYNFVYEIIEKLSLDLNIDLYILEKKIIINSPINKRFNTIDRKFPVYSKSPLELIDNKQLILEHFNVKIIKTISEDFDFIIDFCEENLEMENVFSVKTNFNKNEISRFISNTGFVELKFENHKKEEKFIFKFHNEKGLTNNYFKYLYSISDTIRLFVEGSFIILTKNIEIPNHESIYRYYFSLGKKILVRKFNKKQLNWKLAFLDKDNTIKKIEIKKGEYWADPFIVCNEDGKYIFFEELENLSRKGVISVLKLDDDDNEIIEKKEVLNMPFHMSFPNVFKHLDNYYMLPEQIESNQLVLYKAKKFPDDWEKHHVVFENTKAIDPSIVFHEGLYYMFTNIVEDYEYDNNERMSIFYTEDILSGNWKEHSQNPVKVDISSTRNAGRIYEEHGDLIRVAQNCNPTYGFSTKKMKIIKLSPTEFEEEEQEHIKLKDYEGNHTFNKVSDLAVIDVLVKE